MVRKYVSRDCFSIQQGYGNFFDSLEVGVSVGSKEVCGGCVCGRGGGCG